MTGLVSITFRSLPPEEVIRLARDNRLDAIEWGGDVHVPAGDIAVAQKVAEMTRAAGLTNYSYGSYYKIGASPREDFDGVLACARALGVGVIRVWAGACGSAEMTAEDYCTAVEDARRIADMAEGMTICLECHNNTLTDEYHAALKFIEDVGRGNLATYWQPNQYRDHAYNLEAAGALAPMTHAVHVFSWEGDTWLPLAAHAARWREYIDTVRAVRPDIPFMLEFMHDHDPATLPATAACLNEWMQ